MKAPSNTTGQERRFAGAIEILQSGISQRAFPGAAFAVTYQGHTVASSAVGNFTYETGSPRVTPETIYDLASLTKVVATTTAAMILYERGELRLDARVVDLLPKFSAGGARKWEVTIEMLLSHCSGLPAHLKLYEIARTREQALQAVMALPLEAEPGTRAKYSDIGFIVLGEALARLTGEALDSFCAKEIFGPLGMSQARFSPPQDWKLLIPPTIEDDSFRHRTVQGEVNDENASILGGVAGHAGLFANVRDIAAFAECMMRGGTPILKRPAIDLFTRRRSVPRGSSWALGWDTPSASSQSGRFFSAESFGHLGYTGTSLWIDPRRQLSVTLLANRTWPDTESQRIKQLRPAFHDAIVDALENQ